ncbi:MAG: pyruvate, phosphate dikinase [Acidimicrobiia bacterium]|nr:pyruvate, phosphate dikinase [Acidimicrobiia bacterium]
MTQQWVVSFADGDGDARALLGGKGAGLASMTKAGLPVPPGFIITTEACRAYYETDRLGPEGLWDEVSAAIRVVEEATAKSFGDPRNPLLFSVRSGASVSMPGMMDTILNLGLNASSVEGLAELTGDDQFAWDAYRRFVQMFGNIVFGVPSDLMAEVVERAQVAAGGLGSKIPATESRALVKRLKDIVDGYSGRAVPDDPAEQLALAVGAVFDSWGNRRAVDYRRVNGIANDLFTAVSVQAMVFGNAGAGSGTGVAFTRNPTSGERELYGEFLEDAQGEDVVAGTRTPQPIAALADAMPAVYTQFLDIAGRLEHHYRDMQDLEFTVEVGRLWMLQTRTGKRGGRAAIRIAVDMVEEGLITREEAVQRITADRLDELLHPVVVAGPEDEVITEGLPASPGGAFGVVVFDADEAVDLAEKGTPVVLVRHETSPDDFHGMVAASAIVTSRGGVTSHAAVVARGMGKCCVVGCESMWVDYSEQLFRVGDRVVSKGEWVTVDGNKGQVLAGRVATVEPELDEFYETLMSWADEFRTLQVRANADAPADSAAARRLGAEGIGLCRTEHMFFGEERTEAVREMIMAPNAVARADALAKIAPLQTADFVGIFEAMDGFPVTIRLLDPPLHEFLPGREETVLRITDLKLRLAHAKSLDKINRLLNEINEREQILAQIERLAEANPMLGHRGCRLGIAYPEITEMQVRAIFTAAVQCVERGIDVHPEVMIPLVAFATEYAHQEEVVRRVAEEVLAGHGLRVPYLVGSMIELPRAALTAHEIAEKAEFFSFGTNDLTQSAAGLSRDDSSRFLPGYVRRGLISTDPFQSLDVTGVGQLVEMGIERGRSVRPELKIGVCGEHGGDPASIGFFQRVGLDYVSCSTYRVPVARLAAAHAALSSD